MEEIIDFLENVKIDLVSQQAALGIRASGRSANSLQVTKGPNPELRGSNYWAFLMDGQGRGPGKAPPREDIEDWIFDKGITIETTLHNAAFQIAKKIGEQGTRIYKGSTPGISLDEIISKNLKETVKYIARRDAEELLKPFRK